MNESQFGWPRRWTRVVLLVTFFPGRGGVETFIENMASALESIGVEVDIVSVWPGSGRTTRRVHTVFARDELHRGSVTSRALSVRTLALVPKLVFKRLDRWVQLHRLGQVLWKYPDNTIVIVTGYREGELVNQLRHGRRRVRPLMIGQFHSSFDSIDTYDIDVLARVREAFSAVDGFVALNPEDARRFAPNLRVPSVGIPNPLREGTPVGGADLSHRGRSRRVVALVRYAPEKRIDRMIRNFLRATSVEDLAEWRLDIYGEGPERSALQALIDHLDSTGRVRLMGWTDDASAVFADARLNLLTSTYEGFGLAVVEAAQNSVPSLVFACSPGLTSLVNQLEGFTVTPDDDEAYIARLTAVLRDLDLLEEKGRVARHNVSAYSPTSVLSEWARFIEHISETRRERSNG